MNLSWMQPALANARKSEEGVHEVAHTSKAGSETSNKDKGRVLRIMVRSHDQDKVNVNLPLSLGVSFLKKGSKNIASNNPAIDQVDFDDVERLIKEGVLGEIVNIESHEGDTVRIVVE